MSTRIIQSSSFDKSELMVLLHRKVSGLASQKAAFVNNFKHIFALTEEKSLWPLSYLNAKKVFQWA